MPFVLRHTATSQIFTCILTNHYHLTYYGTKFWDREEEALQQFGLFLEERGIGDVKLWELMEIEESTMKIYNVKLKNDLTNLLFLDEQGKPLVKKIG